LRLAVAVLVRRCVTGQWVAQAYKFQRLFRNWRDGSERERGRRYRFLCVVLLFRSLWFNARCFIWTSASRNNSLPVANFFCRGVGNYTHRYGLRHTKLKIRCAPLLPCWFRVVQRGNGVCSVDYSARCVYLIFVSSKN
jgi:hypothetical protein